MNMEMNGHNPDLPKVIQPGSAAAEKLAAERSTNTGFFRGLITNSSVQLGSFEHDDSGRPVAPVYRNLWEEDAAAEAHKVREKFLASQKPAH